MHCTLAAMCLRLRNGCGHSGVLRGPPTEIWRCSAEGGTWRGHRAGSQSPQTGERQRTTAQRSINGIRSYVGVDSRKAVPLRRTLQALARLPPTGDLHQGLRQDCDVDHLPWFHELPLTPVPLGQQWKQNQQREPWIGH